MLGIALGVAALIIVLSVMNGFQKEVRDRMLVGDLAHRGLRRRRRRARRLARTVDARRGATRRWSAPRRSSPRRR